MNVIFKKPNWACFVINYNFMSIRNADLQISAHVYMWAHLSTGRCSVINKTRFIYIILKCPWLEALVGNIQIMVECEWQRSRRKLLSTRPLRQTVLIEISMLCSTWLSKTGGSNWEFKVAQSIGLVSMAMRWQGILNYLVKFATRVSSEPVKELKYSACLWS